MLHEKLMDCVQLPQAVSYTSCYTDISSNIYPLAPSGESCSRVIDERVMKREWDKMKETTRSKEPDSSTDNSNPRTEYRRNRITSS